MRTKHTIRTLAFALLSLLWALPAAAQTALTCTIPATADITRLRALCEELRVDLRAPLVDWDDSVCASQMLRIGLRARESVSARVAARSTVDTALQDYDTNWPLIEQGRCGDGIIQTESPFLEVCDDGVNDGTACNADCSLP